VCAEFVVEQPFLHNVHAEEERHDGSPGAPAQHGLAIAIQSGAIADPKALQMHMGHNSIVITLDRYGHLLPGPTPASPDRMADRYADRASVIRLEGRRASPR
jgi:integrase